MVLISELSKSDGLGVATIQARIIDMFFSPAHLVYLVAADPSGRILVEVRESIDQTLEVDSIVSIHGTVVLDKGHILIRATDIQKLQEAEYAFQQLADLSVPPPSDLPSYEADRWVKPNEEMERIQSAVFATYRKIWYAIVGIVLIGVGIFVPPVFSWLFIVGGLFLIILGLFVERTTVKSVEKVS